MPLRHNARMSIETDIIEWALTRPAWQQRVLVDLANGEDYAAAEIAKLADLIISGAANEPRQDANKLSLKSSEPETVSLTSILDVKGVNGLLDGGSLEFAPSGLTVIFGANGSGKSGYARLIKHMVGARHSSEILPDVFEANPDQPTAKLTFKVGSETLLEDFPGLAGPDVRKIGFYDEHCGDAYLAKQSTITYRPSALGVIDGLISVCDAVRYELQRRIDASDASRLQLQIDTSTVAGSFYANLSHTTSDQSIDVATKLAPDAPELRAEALREEARLKTTDPAKEQALLLARASSLRSLKAHVVKLEVALGADAQTKTEEARQVADARRQAATLAVTQNTAEADLPGVGATAWRTLWDAARRYSTDVAYPTHDFPHVGDAARCVLCQQELDADATTRLQRFERYMTDTTERDARSAENSFDAHVAGMRTAIPGTAESSSALATLTGIDAKLGTSVQELLAGLEQQQTLMLTYFCDSGPEPSPLTSSPLIDKLEEMAAALSLRADETDVKSFQRALDAATAARKEADASAILAKAADSLRQEVGRQKTSKALQSARVRADTSGITQKSSQLARTYATDLILDQFTRETDRLKLTRVTLQDLGGKKGQLNQRPGLLGVKHKNASAVSVLSEGEQTALGLAGFFTEAEFDTSKSAIVLDDPVTSLDHVRRENVAARLVEFAADRQVVVFSHEISFIGNLVKAAEDASISTAPRSIERVGKWQPGFIRSELPWRAKDFGARKNELDTGLARLTKERATLTDTEYEKRVSAWAGSLSETWERCVTTEVINKLFDMGSSEVRPLAFRLLAKITPDDNDDFQAGYGASSKWARRHDNAAVTNYIPPEPEDMKVEFDRLVAWQKRLKSYL